MGGSCLFLRESFCACCCTRSLGGNLRLSKSRTVVRLFYSRKMKQRIFVFICVFFSVFSLQAQDLMPVKDWKTGMYGYKQTNHTEWSIMPQYQEAGYFQNRIAIVKSQNSEFAINSKNERISKNFKFLNEYSYGKQFIYIGSVTGEKDWNLYDASFTPLLKSSYDNILHWGVKEKSIILRVERNGLVGYVDLEGKEVLPIAFKIAQFDNYYYRCGYKKCQKDNITEKQFNDYFLNVCDVNGKWGVVTIDGVIIVPFKYASEYKLYKAAKGFYQKGFKPYILNISKNEKANSLFERIADANNHMMRVNAEIIKTYPTEIPVIEKAKVQKNKNGYVFYKANKVIGGFYENVENLGNFYIVKKQKYGVNDLYGESVLPCEYDDINVWNYNDKANILLVKKEEKFGLFDIEGKEIERCRFDMITSPVNGYGTALTNGKVWLLGNNGYTLSKRAYDFIDISEDGVITASLLGYQTNLDNDGKEKESITKQVFEKAYNMPLEENAQAKFDLYNLCVLLDNNEGYEDKALNNIGVMFENLGDEDTALEYYYKSGSEQARKNIKNIKLNRLVNTLQQVSQTLTQTAQMLDKSKSYSDILYSSGGGGKTFESSMSTHTDRGGLSEDYYKNMYARWERNAKSAYESLTNAGYKIKKNGKDASGSANGTWGGGNFTAMKQNLRTAQREMRDLRSKARRDGYTIPQSNYETVNVSF